MRFKNHYFSAGQVGYLVQDLLEIAKEQYEVLEFVTAVSHVKAFEVRLPKLKKYFKFEEKKGNMLMISAMVCILGRLD